MAVKSTRATQSKVTSEVTPDVVEEVTSEVKNEDENVVTSEVENAKLSLSEYLATAKVNKGLVASYQCEGRFDPELLERKTVGKWEEAFAKQAARTY